MPVLPDGPPAGLSEIGVTVALFTLRDGRVVRIRPVVPADRPAVVDFVRHVSQKSLELRFFCGVPDEAAIEEVMAQGRTTERLSLLVETVDSTREAVIGHGEYVRTPDDASRAEVALLVADDHQGLGAGTLLLRELGRRARSVGIRSFDAIVLTENIAMRNVFTMSGYPCSLIVDRGQSEVILDVTRAYQTSLAVIDPVRTVPILVA